MPDIATCVLPHTLSDTPPKPCNGPECSSKHARCVLLTIRSNISRLRRVQEAPVSTRAVTLIPDRIRLTVGRPLT